jgi:DNA-binding MarR family transcriptional regulator
MASSEIVSDLSIGRPAVTVDDDFEVEFPDARRAATLSAVNLIRTADRLLDEIDRRRRTVVDLSASAAQILAIVEGAGEPLSPHVVAERLLVTSGTMTALLDTLERRGLVRRVPHPSDRRKLLIDITDEARAVLDRMLPRVHGASRDVFAVLSDRECRTLGRLLGRLHTRLDALKGQPLSERVERRVRPARHRLDGPNRGRDDGSTRRRESDAHGDHQPT